VRTYVDFGSKFASSEDFYKIFLGNKSILVQQIKIDGIHAQVGSQLLQGIQVDGLVSHAVVVGKPEFRNPSLQGHLTTLKAQFRLVTGSGFSPFVTSGRCAASAGTLPSANPFSGLNGAFRRL
jgi:hypothetical protein